MHESHIPQDAIWEERWHPLREEWVVIAAHRQNRLWIGATIETSERSVPAYLPDCYLCPDNHRINGAVNPLCEQTYVFDNDHPCVGTDAPISPVTPPAPYRVRPAQGYARIFCYSPRHNLTVAEMPVNAIAEIAHVWQQQIIHPFAVPTSSNIWQDQKSVEVICE